MSERSSISNQWHATAIFLIAVATRSLYFLQFQKNPLFNYIPEHTDSHHYDVGALSFSNGDWMATAAVNIFSPLYKYLIGFIYMAFGRNLPTVWFFQLLMGAFTVLLIFLICEKLFNQRTAWISALLYNFHGPVLMYEGILLRASMIAFLGTLSLYLLVRLPEKANWKELALTGLGISLFIQSRPNTILVFALIFIYWLFIARKKSMPSNSKVILWTGLFFIPLLVQAGLTHGKFVFFEFSGPASILHGNHPEHLGMGHSAEHHHPNAYQLNFKETIGIFFLRFVEHPLEMAFLYARKLYFFFCSFQVPNNFDYNLFKDFSFLLHGPLSNFALLSSLGLVGFVLAFKERKKLWILYCYAIGMTCAVILFFVLARYRITVIPYFAIFSGVAVDKIVENFKGRQMFIGIANTASALALFAFFNYQALIPDFKLIGHKSYDQRIGEYYVRAGRLAEGHDRIMTFRNHFPEEAGASKVLGMIYQQTHQYQKAIREFERADHLEPGNSWTQKQWNKNRKMLEAKNP